VKKQLLSRTLIPDVHELDFVSSYLGHHAPLGTSDRTDESRVHRPLLMTYKYSCDFDPSFVPLLPEIYKQSPPSTHTKYPASSNSTKKLAAVSNFWVMQKVVQ